MRTMARRVWSKVCCGQKWLLLLAPIFLLFLTISVMITTLPLPLPPTNVDRRSSRALSSAAEFKPNPGVMELPPAAAFQQPLSHFHRGASSAWKETPKHSVPPKPFGHNAAGDDKNSIKEKSHADLHRNKHKSKGTASKRKEKAGAVHSTVHRSHNSPEFTVNNIGSKHRIKLSSHGATVKRTVQAYTHLERSKSTVAHAPAQAHTPTIYWAAERHADRWEDRHHNRNAETQIHDSHTSANLAEHHQALEKNRQHSDKVSKKDQPVKKHFGDLKKYYNLSKDPSEAKKSPGSLDHKKTFSKPEAAMKKDDSGWCVSITERDFSDSDNRSIRFSPEVQPLPWFSEDDIQKMVLLAVGEVVSKVKVPAHGQVLQVALDPPTHQQQPSLKRGMAQHGPGLRHPKTHHEHCQQGHCSLIKRTEDWFEVFAFHLDRVLGLNRSLPAVFRTFRSEILPYRYTRGNPRPVVWWDPDIQHLADTDNDQNSVPLSWVQYQKLLQAHCGREADLRTLPCMGIHHSEWGRLALFDFLLQVNDRLDRYCCGFTPDPTELCVENLLHPQCGNPRDLLLVHILVRKADPSRLVFIDNAGRPQQSSDNLNFRLVEGIDEFPKRAVSVLRSGCLESLLLHSLYTDKEFWDSQGGASGLRPLIHSVEHRGKILLQHIRDKKLQLKRDL